MRYGPWSSYRPSNSANSVCALSDERACSSSGRSSAHLQNLGHALQHARLVELVYCVDGKLSNLRVGTQAAQSTEPVPQLPNIDFPVLRGRNTPRVQPEVKQRSVQGLIVYLPSTSAVAGRCREIQTHMLFPATKLDGYQVASLRGNGQLVLDSFFHLGV